MAGRPRIGFFGTIFLVDAIFIWYQISKPREGYFSRPALTNSTGLPMPKAARTSTTKPSAAPQKATHRRLPAIRWWSSLASCSACSSTVNIRRGNHFSAGSIRRGCTSIRFSNPLRKAKRACKFVADGMTEFDGMVGQLLKKLDDLGIADNTIVIWTTDNGAETFSWPDGGTTPFKAEKNTNWEGGYRAPCAMRWPGVIKPGTDINDLTSHEDFVNEGNSFIGPTMVILRASASTVGRWPFWNNDRWG